MEQLTMKNISEAQIKKICLLYKQGDADRSKVMSAREVARKIEKEFGLETSDYFVASVIKRFGNKYDTAMRSQSKAIRMRIERDRRKESEPKNGRYAHIK